MRCQISKDGWPQVPNFQLSGGKNGRCHETTLRTPFSLLTLEALVDGVHIAVTRAIYAVITPFLWQYGGSTLLPLPSNV